MNVALFLEIKNEYTEHLVETLTPYIYEGLTSIYKEAVRLAEETKYEDKILIIFQKLLQSINTWSQIRISEETTRIKQLSNTSDYLDDLIKAVIKSNIILLAYSNSISNIICQSFYNSLTTSTFIHRCYTECGKDAHNNPYLFFHDIDPMDYKRNQIIIHQHIQSGINRAIRKILPISMILKEYLVNSVNIMMEPPKVELVGTGGNIIETMPPAQPEIPTKPIISTGGAAPNLSDKLDSKLENEVMKLIKTESNKSEKQKIQTIMNLDKIITSLEQPKLSDVKPAFSSNKKVLSSISKNDILNVPHMMERDRNDDVNDFIHNQFGQSDKNIVNINFDEEPTMVSGSNKKTVSATTLNGRGMPGRTGMKMNPETSERVDPSRISLIEDYGNQIGGRRKLNSRQA